MMLKNAQVGTEEFHADNRERSKKIISDEKMTVGGGRITAADSTTALFTGYKKLKRIL